MAETPSTNPWNDRIAAFAGAVKKEAKDVSDALVPLVGEPGDDALVILGDPSALSDDDLAAALVETGPKIPKGVFRKHLPALRGPAPAQPVEATREREASLDILPSVPEDASFLELLKTGGVLKVEKTEVMSAIRAGIASWLGLYDLPDAIAQRMEQFATEQEEPVGQSYWKLHKLVTSRSYAEVLSILEVPGNFVSERRKKEFLSKLNGELWTVLRGFHNQLVAWQDSWMKGAANPAMALSMLAFAQQGGGMMPPGMMQPPETDPLRDEAESVINRINKVFAGVGIPIARALAYDAMRIKEVLEEPGLPVTIGATNKDQMLKSLNIAVGADYVRLERNITRYALAIMELPKVSAGKEEYGYLGAMLMLGSAIPWDKLPDVTRKSADTRSERPDGRFKADPYANR